MIIEKYYIVVIIWLVRKIILKKKSIYENKDKNILYVIDDKFEVCVLMFCNILIDVIDWLLDFLLLILEFFLIYNIESYC